MRKISIIILLFLLIYSCQFINTSNKNNNKYDGTYSVSFICAENCLANSIFNINDGKIKTIIQNINKQTFIVDGFVVEKSGKLKLSISSSSNEIVKASGNIFTEGLLQGTYNIGNRKCKFIGTLITRNKNEIVTKYDGIYNINFKRKEKLIASSEIKISNGEFHTFISTINKDIYKVEGKISKKGKILLNTIFSNLKGITALGSITDGVIEGEYYISNGIKGNFSGQLIRPLNLQNKD